MKKRLVIGILAHVDAGKTTLSEALLYQSGAIRRLGRVDHQDAFLDNFALERERGITIFSKQARLSLPDVEIQLLDTPGHVDFSAEMERTLQVLDAAVLVISGTDGVQGHTRTLWYLLKRFHVPVFVFVNKMDLAGTDRNVLLRELKSRLNDSCVDFTEDGPARMEEIALQSETAMDEYLDTGAVKDATVSEMIARRELFPCWFGSALRLTGVANFLQGLSHLASCGAYPEDFGARVYKISRDAQGVRLTWMKITGGVLRVRMPLSGNGSGEKWEEKVDQIRLYSGEKFKTAGQVPAGIICAVTGLSHTVPGEGLGNTLPGATPILEPVLTYRVILPEGCSPHTALEKFQELSEEDPTLHIVWNAQLHQIHIQLMGEIQREVLQRLIASRFGIDVTFGEGSIVYRETIGTTVEGVGHYEPLRHYAEVHLLLTPGERGSGLQFDTICPEDVLDGHWQRLILSHLKEREFPGVLTGSPITDMKITLAAGKDSVKHTEGGDFRQATYRALRQGLMQAKSILLEPWYCFRLELPTSQVGRALTDIQRMGGTVDAPETTGEESVLTGSAPVEGLCGYAADIAAYTHGMGRLSCILKDYEPCRNTEAVIAAIGYNPEQDRDNPADSVFCIHSASGLVKWDKVPEYMHLPSVLQPEKRDNPAVHSAVPEVHTPKVSGTFEQDGELQTIFERTYGPVKRRDILPAELRRRREVAASEKRSIQKQPPRMEYLLVDGYNIIYSWDELKAVAQDNMDAARKNLMDILCNYQGYRKCEVILVFDAYKVPHNATGEVTTYHNIHVVYTREAETADSYIEKATYALGSEYQIRVATSDGAEQLIILGHNALRIPASAFHEEVEQVEGQIADVLARNNRKASSRGMKAAMEKAGMSGMVPIVPGSASGKKSVPGERGKERH